MTQKAPSARVRRPFRFLLLLVNLALLIGLGLQACLVVWLYPDGRLDLPPSLLKKVQAAARDKGYTLDFKSFDIDLRGYLALENLQIGLTDIDEPVVEVERLLVSFQPFFLLVGHFSPQELRVLDATAYCPAIHSPTGQREPVIEDFSLHAEQNGHLWDLHRLHFRAAGFDVAAAGPLPMRLLNSLRAKPEAKLPPDPQKVLREAADYLLRTAELTEALEAPIILLNLESDNAEGAPVKLYLQSQGYTYAPANLEVGMNSLRAHLHIGYDHILRASEPAIAQAFSLKYGDQAASGLSELRVSLANGTHGVLAMPKSATMFAYDLEYLDLKFDGAILDMQPAGGQSYDFIASVKRSQNWVDANGRIDLQRSAASFNVFGRWSPDFFLKARPFAEMKELPKIHFAERPYFNAKVKLAPGWKFEHTWLELDSGPASYENLKVLNLYTQATLEPGQLHLKHTEIDTHDYTIHGRYWQDLKTDDYRFLLRGTVQPTDISPIIDEDWWPEIFNRFKYADGLPYANIDLRGRYGGGRQYKKMFGYVKVPQCSYNGISVDQVSTYLYQMPSRFNLMDLYIEQGKQATLADLQFNYAPSTGDRVSLAFAAHSSMPLKEVAAIIGQEAADFEDIIATEHPATISGYGISYDEHSSHPDALFLNISGNFPQDAVFQGITFDSLACEVKVEPTQVVVSQLDASLAKGKLQGSAILQKPKDGERRLQLDLDLNGAQLYDVFTVIPELKEIREKSESKDADKTSAQPQMTPEERFAGVLDINFKGAGTQGDMASFSGGGKAMLEQAHLGRLHLFGGLSRLMQGMGVGFGTVDFTKAAVTYTLGNAIIYVPEGDISGSTARIKTNGYYNTDTGKIDFVMTLYPLGGISMPILSTVLSALNPVTNTIEVELSGSLEEPNWKTTFGLIRVFTGQKKVEDPIDTDSDAAQ